VISDAPGLDTPRLKTLACVAALVAGATGEIWLTTVNAQHYMPLLLFLALVDRKDSPAKRALYLVTAAVTGLSSVSANFLAPLFLLQWHRRRCATDAHMFAVLACTAALQVACIAYSALAIGSSAYYHPTQVRGTASGLGTPLWAIWYFGVAYPVFGRFHGIYQVAPLVLLAALVTCGRRTTARLSTHWLAAALLTVLSVLGSFGMEGGERYAYASTVILSLALLRAAHDPQLTRPRRAFVLLVWLAGTVAWLAAFGPGMRLFDDPAWPQWKDEVALWRQDPAHVLRVPPVWDYQTRAGIVWVVHPPGRADLP
jgi:hypothetical protein